MNKRAVYKNLAEYIKITFPNVYQGNINSNEVSFGSVIEKNSDDFKVKIGNILKTGKRPGGTVRNNKPHHTKVVCSG
jgi:hypothetical protein